MIYKKAEAIIFQAMYSLEGFREEKKYKESDDLRKLLLRLGIHTECRKDNSVRFYAIGRFRNFCVQMNRVFERYYEPKAYRVQRNDR